jgi:hypothetical protein
MTKLFGGAIVRNYAAELGVTVNSVSLEKFIEEPELAVEDLIVRDDLRDGALVDVMKALLTLDYRSRPTGAHSSFLPRGPTMTGHSVN